MSCVYPKEYFPYGTIGSIEEDICLAVAMQNGFPITHKRLMNSGGDAFCDKGTIEIRYSSTIERQEGIFYQWPFITAKRKMSNANYFIMIGGGTKNRYFIVPRNNLLAMLKDKRGLFLNISPYPNRKSKKRTGDYLLLYENAWWILGNDSKL